MERFTTQSLLFLLLLVIVTIGSSSSLVTKLIHRDSIYSPFRKPNSTLYTRAIDAIKSSKARASFLKAKMNNRVVIDDYQLSIFPDDEGYAFIANITIGTPPIEKYLALDSGSSLTWVQCENCKDCKPQKWAKFDPYSSKSYVPVKCNTGACNVVAANHCGTNNLCEYNANYGDNSTTVGILATETITFKTKDDGIAMVPDILIGCGMSNVDHADNQTGGVLGLGPREFSLPNHMGSAFSYCLGNLSKLDYEWNVLVVGTDALLQGKPSPLKASGDYYYVSLEGINVDRQPLEINSDVFKLHEDNTGGVIIDSGSTFTHLPTIAYSALVDEIDNLLEYEIPRAYRYDDQLLCYWGRISDHIKEYLPRVTLKFANGADLELEAYSLFAQVEPNVFCMMIREAETDFGIIGVYAQQFHNVGYNLSNSTIHFLMAACELVFIGE